MGAACFLLQHDEDLHRSKALPITAISTLYIRYSGIAVPLIVNILSTSPLLRLPPQILATSDEHAVVEQLWEKVTDGELSGNGCAQVEIRLVDEGASVDRGDRD